MHLFNGMTALHLAALRGDDPLFIEKLLKRGAQLDCVDVFGREKIKELFIQHKHSIEEANRVQNILRR